MVDRMNDGAYRRLDPNDNSIMVLGKNRLNPQVYKQRFVTVSSCNKDEFDRQVNEKLSDNWEIMHLTTSLAPEPFPLPGSLRYIAFLSKYVRVDEEDNDERT